MRLDCYYPGVLLDGNHILRYNGNNLNDQISISLILHYFKRDSYIFMLMSGLRSVEGRDMFAVTHLAKLGVKDRDRI